MGHVRKNPKNGGSVDSVDADYLQHGIERQGRRQPLFNDSHEHISRDLDCEIDLVKLTRRFAERVLALLRQKELISDEDVVQILSQEHTGFSVWAGEPFEDKERTLFVARYIRLRPSGSPGALQLPSIRTARLSGAR